MFKTKINKFKVRKNKLYGQKGLKMAKNANKTCVFSEGGIPVDQNTNYFIIS